MDTNLSHFTIDDSLKRYSEALVHLSHCAPKKTFDDVLEYVKKHQLYKQALQSYNGHREQYDVELQFERANNRLFLDVLLIFLLKIIDLLMLDWVCILLTFSL